MLNTKKIDNWRKNKVDIKEIFYSSLYLPSPLPSMSSIQDMLQAVRDGIIDVPTFLFYLSKIPSDWFRKNTFDFKPEDFDQMIGLCYVYMYPDTLNNVRSYYFGKENFDDMLKRLSLMHFPLDMSRFEGMEKIKVEKIMTDFHDIILCQVIYTDEAFAFHNNFRDACDAYGYDLPKAIKAVKGL